MLNLITLICKKLNKGKSIKAIANEVEKNVEMVKEIAIIAERYLPDYDEEKIYKEWKEKITVWSIFYTKFICLVDKREDSWQPVRLIKNPLANLQRKI